MTAALTGQGVESYSRELREHAAIMRRYAVNGPADILEACAAGLEARVREWQCEALTLEQAVIESGYSYSALQKKLGDGDLENVGRHGAPRVRRADLPRKTSKTTNMDLADGILAGRG